MSRIILALLCLVPFSPVLALSQTTGTATAAAPAAAPAPNPGINPKEEQKEVPAKSEFVLVEKDGKLRGDSPASIGESIYIKATGKTAENLDTPDVLKTLKLYLDDEPMDKLTISAVRNGTEVMLSARLARDPSVEENRKAWDRLLRKQNDRTMNLSVALAVGNKLPVLVQPASGLSFYVAPPTWQWLAFGIGFLIFIGVYFFLVRDNTILRDKKGGFYSLGKSQMAFWGLLVLLTFVGICILTRTMEPISKQVLVLLGISGTTGLGAIMVGASNEKALGDEKAKILADQAAAGGAAPPDAQQLRLNEIDSKLKAPVTKPGMRDFFTNIIDDGNGPSFHRLQIVLWTVVLGGIFVFGVMHMISMPEFPDTVLILMGISSGTYLGFKSQEGH